MAKMLLIFAGMLSLFIGTWTVKAHSPRHSPSGEQTDYSAGAWWLPESDEVDPEWVLDPEIPENYLPVPGEDELYMVIDNDGNILGYRQRTKQEDGSWEWADVNPDIPNNYEAVDGLENIYKVTADDGTVSYYQYIRNEDDTFAFVPVDEKGKPLNEQATDGNVIPDNYRRITGNIYGVLNEYGVVIGYKERCPNSDGSYTWVDCAKPVIKDNGSSAIVEEKDPPENTSSDQPSVTPPDEQTLPSSSSSAETKPTIPGNTNNNGEIVQQGDGTYIQTETLLTSETAGGWVTTYQTVITRVYSEDGVLLSTKKDGPKEISKVKAGGNDPGAPDKNKIAATLSEELARVSVGINYKTDLAKEILNELNAERSAEGLSALKMDTNSAAYKLAQIRAADMAIYNHSDYDSPSYGTLAEMMDRFHIQSAIPSENTWKTTTSKNAGAVHARFMLHEGSRNAMMSKDYTNIGIAVVQKNGYYYICEVLVD